LSDAEARLSIPVVAFFNNKGGVGKTSLVYHTAFMLAELGVRCLAVDLDPQANLTSAFLSEESLEQYWGLEFAESDPRATTIYRCVKPLLGVGDLLQAVVLQLQSDLLLLPGDLALAGFEDALAEQWLKCFGDKELYRPFRITTAFWQIAQSAAQRAGARVILFDVGPNLGAINRAALVASDHVVVPLAGDLFSIQGLRNLGPTLNDWRSGWTKRLDNYKSPGMELPKGEMLPAGYVVQQHQMRLDRPVKAYNRWMDRIPFEYRSAGLSSAAAAISVKEDPECLALVKHYRSLIPMAQEARLPIFLLRAAHGAMGSHANAVQQARVEFEAFTRKLLSKIGIAIAPPFTQLQLT